VEVTPTQADYDAAKPFFNEGGPAYPLLVQAFARHRASEAERVRESTSLQKTQTTAERVREAAVALVAKLDECDPHLTSVFSFALAHDHLYSGPTYGEELEALRAAIRSLPIGEA